MGDDLATANFIVIEKVKLDHFNLSTTVYGTGLNVSPGQLGERLTAWLALFS